MQPFNITDVGHSFKRVAFAISRSSSVGSTSGYKLETCEWHFLFCASCFRLRMNVVWDALPRCVPRCRAAVLSRAFRAFRAAFRAAALSALLSALSVSRFVAWALSALLSALSVSRFVAPGPRLVTKRSAVLRFYPVSIVKWLDCSQVGLFSSTSPSWSTQGSPADQCLSSSVSSLHRGHANLLCIVPMHLLRVMLT